MRDACHQTVAAATPKPADISLIENAMVQMPTMTKAVSFFPFGSLERCFKLMAGGEDRREEGELDVGGHFHQAEISIQSHSAARPAM
jgi:hypothetical protein